MHDLLFTLPGANYPFDQSVRVRVDGARQLVERTDGTSVHLIECTTDQVDRIADEALESLSAPAQVCRACGALSASSDFVEVFERMHYACFHFVFEHGDTDRDQPCGLAGCPSG